MLNRKQTVIDHIRTAIINGQIKPGQKLPSIRELSQRLACSLNTIVSAYQELERAYLIYSRPKSGYYVVAQEPLVSILQNERIDFTAAAPDPSSMSHMEFRQCLIKSMELFEASIFSYSDPQGLLSLRQEVVKLFHKQQVFASEQQVFIFAGAQQALHLLSGMPFPNGKTNILVEQPTYWGMLESLSTQSQSVIGIERTPEGIDWVELERHFQSNMIKFFYTIPRYHNPLGTSYNPKEKQRIAELAQKYDVYIVEDDYLADFETNAKADPIWAYNGANQVIYLRSFSKVMLPGLRLAAATVPHSIVPSLQQHKRTADLSTSVLSQGVLEIFLQSGMYEHHTKQMRSLYNQRVNKLKEVSGHLLPKEFLYSIPTSGGLFSAINLHDIHTEDLVARLNKRGVDVLPTGPQFLPSYPKMNLLRMSIMRTNEQDIDRGLEILAEELEQAKLTVRAYKPSLWI